MKRKSFASFKPATPWAPSSCNPLCPRKAYAGSTARLGSGRSNGWQAAARTPGHYSCKAY
jgi:hypothetical protein